MGKKDYSESELFDDGWIKVWFLFEAQGLKKEAIEKALKKHIEKIEARNDTKGVESKFTSIESVELTPQMKEMLKKKGAKELYSQVVETTFYVRNFESLVHMVITYAPTALEILGPKKITLSIGDAQSSLAHVADLIHKFAAAGIGGMLVHGD